MPASDSGSRRAAGASARADDDLARRLARIVELSHASVMVTDPDGTIVWVNDRAVETSGYAFEELVGETPRILRSDRTPAEVHRDLWATISAGGTWTGDLVNRRRDGRHLHERVMISPIVDEDGEIINYFAIKEDISDRVELERQLKHAQRLESVGRLAAGVAHDFNNMLAAIQGNAQVLRELLLGEGTGEGIGEGARDGGAGRDGARRGRPRGVERLRGAEGEVREALRHIDEAARRAAEVARGLVHFSRKGTEPDETVDPGEILARLRSLAPGLTRVPPVELSIAGSVEARVRGSSAELNQVLQNLVFNAADALPGGGVIRVGLDEVVLEEPRRGSVEVVPPGRWVVFEVRDEGTGMSPEVLDRIFEPFFTTRPRGTGLGLSVTWGIVKRHGGYVDVDTSPGRGSTFRVYLPAVGVSSGGGGAGGRGAVRSEGGGPARAGADGAGAIVLLVDDEAAVRRAYARYLQRLGYRVAEAGGVREGLEVLEAAAPDLVVTDLVMPGGSGETLFREARRVRPALPFLFVSGWAADAPVADLLEEPATDFLPKPPPALDHLARAVERLLADGRGAAAPDPG